VCSRACFQLVNKDARHGIVIGTTGGFVPSILNFTEEDKKSESESEQDSD
jgi:hypothetical protein